MAASTESMFHIAVRHIYESWTTLRIAVEFSGVSDGAEIARWMVDATEEWFNNPKNVGLEVDEVETFLIDVLQDEFNMAQVADDHSLTEIAQMICLSWSLVQKGRGDEAVRRMQALKKPNVSESRAQESSDESDDGEMPASRVPASSSSSQAAAAAPSSAAGDATQREEAPMEEDDGWTTVGKKSSKKRR